MTLEMGTLLSIGLLSIFAIGAGIIAIRSKREEDREASQSH